MIRNIMVDYCRAQSAGKRGGDLIRVNCPSSWGEERHVDLSRSMKRSPGLHAIDPRRAELVEFRFFRRPHREETAEP